MRMHSAVRYPLSLVVSFYFLSVFVVTELLPWVQKKRDADADTNGAAEPQPKKKKKKAAADTVADTADTLAAIAAAPLPVQVHHNLSPPFQLPVWKEQPLALHAVCTHVDHLSNVHMHHPAFLLFASACPELAGSAMVSGYGLAVNLYALSIICAFQGSWLPLCCCNVLTIGFGFVGRTERCRGCGPYREEEKEEEESGNRAARGSSC